MFLLYPARSALGRSPQVEMRQKQKCQTVCKPGSVQLRRAWTVIRLGHASQRASRNQPEQRGGRTPETLAGFRRSYSVLLPVGFTLPPLLPEERCALTAPFHPYLQLCPTVAHGASPGRRFVFCGTFPKVTLASC